jgi:hypothetical protein
MPWSYWSVIEKEGKFMSVFSAMSIGTVCQNGIPSRAYIPWFYVGYLLNVLSTLPELLVSIIGLNRSNEAQHSAVKRLQL